jgi:hypothetical protein
MKTSLTRRLQATGGDWDARPVGSHDPAGSKRQFGAEGGRASIVGTGSRVSGFPSVSDTPRNSVVSDPAQPNSVSDTPRNSASDRQFQRFLDAADNLNSHLASTFDDGFLKIIVAVDGAKSDNVAGTPSQAPSQRSSGNVTPIENAKSWNKQHMAPLAPSDLTTRDAAPIDAGMIVRLHFAEAMMVLLFNALDGKQQNAIKQGFGTLLKEIENLEIKDAPPDAFQAYRDALSAMHKMLSSNPAADELGVALSKDFIKRFHR